MSKLKTTFKCLAIILTILSVIFTAPILLEYKQALFDTNSKYQNLENTLKFLEDVKINHFKDGNFTSSILSLKDVGFREFLDLIEKRVFLNMREAK